MSKRSAESVEQSALKAGERPIAEVPMDEAGSLKTSLRMSSRAKMRFSRPVSTVAQMLSVKKRKRVRTFCDIC